MTKDSARNPKLSIIVAAHSEGLIAHKTMRSVFRAVARLNPSIYEIIVTADNPDKETSDYFARYEHDNRVEVYTVNFGDLADSRNFGIDKARGVYVATLDSDDLVSENWFERGLELLEEIHEDVVLHTNFSVNFGTQDIIWEKFDSTKKSVDAINMVYANRWDSAVICKKSILEKFPYQRNKEGYGSEDWHFNSETLAAGIPHRVVPETCLFVRRKDVSLMTQQSDYKSTVRFTQLLDFNYLKTLDLPISDNPREDSTAKEVNQLQSKKSRVLAVARRAHSVAYSQPLYRKIYHKLKSSLRYTSIETRATVDGRFPEWLLTEWKAIHAIEKQLFPTKTLLESIPLYHSEMFEIGNIFCVLAHQASGALDYVMLVPHLTKGGAELLAMRYINEIHNQHPDWNIAVIATETGDNQWRNKLPEGVRFINFGELYRDFDTSVKLSQLARFIVQSKTKRLHVAQSPLGYVFASQYKLLLKHLAVTCFAFCEDKDSEGRISGHIHSGLPNAYSAISSIFTDNKHVVTQLVNEYAFDPSRFRVHYQPVEYKLIAPKINVAAKGRGTLLWAGRIAKQKRPDILLSIAKQLPDTISIDVYGSFQDGYTEEFFAGAPAISYRGTFDGLQSIGNISSYSGLIYTSENDGIPNILLEACALGLPIVASGSGGIPEFISNETGHLIQDIEDIDAYINAIKSIVTNPKNASNLAKQAQTLITTQHSVSQFKQLIKEDVT